MPVNTAQRRAKRADHRKAATREKRRNETAKNSLSKRVPRASAAPIQQCLVHEKLFKTEMGMLVLTRGVSTFRV